MATTKLGNSKSCSKVINYAEKRAVVKSGVNCMPEYAKAQMKAVRMAHGKDTGVQAHTIIQSFKPGEVTAEQANDLGRQLAESIAEGHQVAIYTHNDTEHIHNHIVINSVDMETGRKYQSNASQIKLVKSENDRICEENGLSVASQKAEIRYTLAERSLLEKNERSWKDEVRETIDMAKQETSDFKGFSEYLEENGVSVTVRGKTITYMHMNENKKVRGKKLGELYTKEGIEGEFERRNTEQERDTSNRDAETRFTNKVERTRKKIDGAKYNSGRTGKSSHGLDEKPTKLDGISLAAGRKIREKRKRYFEERER
ncbi:relaxase/mobilization nuclease domain-containing protein [Bacillus cereus]|uniref:relaxase/mobilization nuclease domain-containing protein n=1 Tax=Bacillus cereus TaxID=1396 RepID=UPI000BF94F32|nr:relaxase/mobilization nuclease domain-containing protein [Bacillus cereus]MED3313456.1 relaxase/mobilization nuclease domain-containing protein [Bacillus thuringiensis]MBH0323607.1 relaxase/mobilization nuclease domain-containing protein [Bacillus cereus]MEB8740799.1 relaxase/mobilization nuclease domain-containing protein [Bacillus cereus]MEB8909576.1 relaxase/mobilization nuclease domain-containing protein [Bacillus cereus]MEB9926273.1 relaxase/mobilization nuclease domain-containing prot